MKASLLLSLGLLLAILASPSTTDDGNTNEGTTVTTASTTSTETPTPTTSTMTPKTDPTSTETPTPTTTSKTDPTSTETPTPTTTPKTDPTSTETPTPTTSTTTPKTDPTSTETPTPTTTPKTDPTSTETPTPTTSTTTPKTDPTSTETPTPTTSTTTPKTDPTSTETPTPTTTPKTDPTSTETPTPTTTPKTDPTSTETPTPTTSTTTPKTDPTSTETPTPTTTPKTDPTSTETPTPTTSTTTPKTDPTSTETPTTTQSPGVSSQTTSPGPQDHCKPNPCGGSASCVNLNTEWFCVCPEGSYYQNASAPCVKGKTFPGEITMKVPESLDWENKTSKVYQDFHNDVVKFFGNALNKTNYGFGQTIILKVSASSSQSTRSAMRASSEMIANVSVANMFSKSTTVHENTITKAIQDEAKKDNKMELYVSKNLCDYYGCEKNEESCQDPLQCTCKPGFTRWSPQNPFCLPLECSRSCSEADRKQCLKNGDGPLKCVCMPGYRRSTDDKCELCPFGYSGQDCKDPFQLILTIVGTIAGAFILILLIAFIVSVSSKNKKRNVEEQKLIEEDLQNVRMQQTGFSNSGFSNSRFSNSGFSNSSDFSNFGAGNSIFPKVRTGVPGQTQNPYANQRSMPRPDY